MLHVGVCSFLERPSDGAIFRAGKLPLHVTVLGNFRLDEQHYAGDGYRPHLTWQGSRSLEVGALVSLNSLSVVDLEPDGNAALRRIAATV